SSFGIMVINWVFPTAFVGVGNWIYVAIPLTFLTGLVSILDSYNNRFGQYKLMATISLIRSIVLNGLRILFGFISPNLFGLIISKLSATIFGVKRQGRYAFSNYKEIFSSTIYEIKNSAVKYKVQPLFSMPGLFVTMFSFSIIPILIN